MERSQLSAKEKLDLLTKSAWAVRDIVNYFGISQSAAYNLRRKAIKDDVTVKVEFGGTKIKADPLLKGFGTTRAAEIDLLNKVIGEGRKA